MADFKNFFREKSIKARDLRKCGNQKKKEMRRRYEKVRLQTATGLSRKM